MRERKKPTRTFVRTDYEQLSQERYKDFKAGYNKAIKKACDWLKVNYGHFDGSIEDLVADFSKEMEE